MFLYLFYRVGSSRRKIVVLTAIKKYPSQISSAFRRFPVASALSLLLFITLVVDTEFLNFIDTVQGTLLARFLVWLGFYPIAAILVSLATSLVQESLKKRNWQPQAITGGAWFVFSLFLTFAFSMDVSWANYYLVATASFIYIAATFGIFIAPFWKDKDENAFWIFLFKNLKALAVGALVATLLFCSVAALVFAFGALFEYEFEEKVFLYFGYFCAGAVFPILYFTGIPSIEECHSETPKLSKFVTSTIRFLFVPVLTLAILLFYAYIAKFILLWDMPQGMVSYFVSGFMLYMLALVTVLYPARLSPGSTFEKKLLKIFPTACIPLVAMMSVGLVRRISDYGISAERIYVVAINIFFYAVIAILLADKIKCKSRFIAIIFCAMFFILTDTPLNALKVTHHVWMESIKGALVEAGYTEYPLNKEDSKAFIRELRKKGDVNTLLIVSRMKNLASDTDPEFREHLTISGYDDIFTDDLTDESCCKDSTDEEPFDPFETSIEYPSKTALQVPPGMKGAVAIDHYFDNDEFEFLGDTLTFRISLKEDSGCSCDSDESDACPDSTAGPAGESATRTVYSFTVDRQTLKQDSVKQIKTAGATLAINYLYAEEASEKSKSLRIRGILFTE